MHRLKTALVGYGYAGKTFHAPLLFAEPGLELALVISSDSAKVQADLPDVVVDRDIDAALRSPEIALIVIATPNDSHVPLAKAALAAGKHVVIDKPFAPTAAEAAEIAWLAEERGRLVSVFHNRRWDSDFLTVAATIRSGAIGTPVHFESHFDRFRPEVRDRWRERALPGSGIWLDLGPHLVDQALQLFGRPAAVQASFARQRPGAEVEDWAHAVLDYGSLRVVLHAAMLVSGGVPRFIVHGDRGSLVKMAADRQEQQLLSGMRPGDPGWGADPDDLLVIGEAGERRVAAVAGDQRHYYAGIAAALRGEAAPPVSAAHSLAVMRVVDAVAHAAASGALVAIDPDIAEHANGVRSKTNRRK